MVPLRLAEVAAAVGGRLRDADPDAVVTGPAVVDSRRVEPGRLFIAIRGERVDGHDFAAEAVRAGAVAALVSRPVGVPAVVVDDTVRALGRLARAVRDALPGLTTVALTGSQGKTGTKDLLAQVLEADGATVAPEGSYNNEIGVPLTVLRATPESRYLVAEMGARGRGHLAYLCTICPPDVGVVLNVGVAHLGEFGSREGIAAAKAEVVAALAPSGVAVLNADDGLVAAMAARTPARVMTFGRSAGADVRVEGVEVGAGGLARFRLRAPDGSAPVRLNVVGEHQADNAAAAAAVAHAVGLPVGDVAQALSGARARSPWRMEVTDRPDGVTVVNDAYNANPDSVRAALSAAVAVAAAPGDGTSRRTVAVLGEMLELGPTAAEEHAGVGRFAAGLGISFVVAVGAGARGIHEAVQRAGGRSVAVPDQADAVDWLAAELRPGDVVLVKASRAAGLERVAHALLATGSGVAAT